MKKPKRPRDFSQLAKLVVDLSTGVKTEPPIPPESYASQFARKGGLVGGKARAKALTKAQRVKIAKKAAKARWGKKS